MGTRRRTASDPVDKVRVAHTASEAFGLADDVRESAMLSDPECVDGPLLPFCNSGRARRIRELADEIEREARRAIGRENG
jgi:hypothetical protein